MLFQYREQTRRLLGDATVARFTPGDIDFYVNQARGQIAGQAECIANLADLAIDYPAQEYPFSAIVPSAGTLGIGGVLTVRKITWTLPAGAGGGGRMFAREWEWFQNFVLAQAPPEYGQPRWWAQLGQGAAGTLWVNPPDGPYALRLDAVCYPAPLALDDEPEALPYQWTDAVPLYAAYLGLLYAQAGEAAANMYKLFELFVQRARANATPSVLPGQYRQAPDLMKQNRLGLARARE